jgi:hypothetical protein
MRIDGVSKRKGLPYRTGVASWLIWAVLAMKG